GSPNKISLWYWNGTGWTFDTPLRLLGVMGTSGPCGSGSGSGSGGGSSAGQTTRIAWFGTSISRTLMATVVAANAGADRLVGLSVPLTYYQTLSGSPSGGGWFGRAPLFQANGYALYLEVSMSGDGDAMAVGAQVVLTPGPVQVIVPAAPPVSFSAGPFSLTSFLATGESGAPLGGFGLALAITE
ncbi:MAG TPA: hypothetical protein VD866_14355, partial [Urbifossiella sp.]|nr:hypothetical protein [Urbifossiella sp.]